MNALFSLIDRLDAVHISYALDAVRSGYIMIEVYVPGERWEIEYSIDGEFEIEIYRSDGKIHDATQLEDLFRRHSD